MWLPKLIGVLMIGLSMQNALAETYNFDADPPPALPSTWLCGVTGRGTAKWLIERDDSAPSQPNVLKQSGSADYPWCVKRDTAIENGFVEVKFKALGGREDQAGGVVWRFKDRDHYYVARANALEDNVSLYYVAAGRRIAIKYVDAPVPRKVWHTLRVEFAAKRIVVSLNGKAYINLADDRVSGAGAVGMWTKADSVIAFDDFAFGATQQK